MNEKVLSVIIPVYNAERTIDYCLESLIDANLEGKYEIICVNDGSNDDSLKKLKKWEEKYLDTIRIIDKANGGMSSARNIGMKTARGEWLFFCDSDDFIAKNSMSAIFDFIHSYPKELGLVKFSMKHVKDVELDEFKGLGEVIFYGSSKDFLLNHTFWTSWTFLFRRDCILNSGIEFFDVRGCEDALFNIEFLLKNKVKVLSIGADVYRYVDNNFSICHTSMSKTSRRYINDALMVLDRYKALTPSPETEPELYKRMQWVSAKMLPNIFARLWHTDMSVKEYSDIKRKLKEIQCLPCEFYLGWKDEIREFLVLHPALFYVFKKILKELKLIKV